MAKSAVIEKPQIKASKPQTVWIGNGNEAVAQAIIQIGYDGEGYYPITPSSVAGQEVAKAFAAGKTDTAFVATTSELAAIGEYILQGREDNAPTLGSLDDASLRSSIPVRWRARHLS